MFHFPPLASPAYSFDRRFRASTARRVAPFGNPRIKARRRLRGAFRSLLRPSSPASAKAFTVCSNFLGYPQQISFIFQRSRYRQLDRKPWHSHGSRAFRFRSTRTTPLTTWRWAGLNRRPPACKAGALPTELHPRFSFPPPLFPRPAWGRRTSKRSLSPPAT